ncbi:MAG: MarR family transcriptional regulator [Actinobacteria bacterium]|nr:MarR family transcriptional regulator [Actinomycetota bacterium]
MAKEVCCSFTKDPVESGPEVFQLIDVVNKKLKRLQRRVIREADLTPPQYSILAMLWEKDGRPFNELASACCCSRATITGIIDTMEKKGLVKREPNPGDRRSLLVKLTEKGEALRRSAPTPQSIFGNCCSGIEPEEFGQLDRLLRKLNDTLA